MYNHMPQSTVAARRNAMVKDGVVEVDSERRKHNVPDAHKYGTAFSVRLAK
jgi:hypothetical protein